MLITTVILIQIILTTILYIYFNPIFLAVDVVITGIFLFKDKNKLIVSLLVLFLTIFHLNLINDNYNNIKDNEFVDINAVVINKNRSNKKYIVKVTNQYNIKFLLTFDLILTISPIFKSFFVVNKNFILY